MANKQFSWNMRSPIAPSNFIMRSEPEKVFDSVVPVQIQLATTTDERQNFVRLTMELVPTGLTTSSFRKDLHVEITDENDPYLFYTLQMSEEDFSVLKSQQGLLIDFSSFPSKFMQLVERCILEHQSETPKFLIILRHQIEMSKPYFLLEIVETNPFKHLCHLSLRMTEGNEAQIKKHLSAKLRQLKEERESGIQMIHSLENQVDQERKNIVQKTAELDLLRCDFQSKLQDMQQLLKVEHQTEKHILQQAKLDLEQQLKSHQLNAAEKEKSLQLHVRELKDKQASLENSLKDNTSRLVKAEEECCRLQQELGSARRRGASLDADFHSKERSVQQLRTKLAVVEQELKDKDALLEKQQDLLAAAQEQKIRLASNLDEKDSTISRREAAVKTMTEELIKANDIIRRLQADIRTLNQKLKTRTDVASEQEKIIKQQGEDITKLRADLNNYVRLQEELSQFKSSIDEKERTIRSNEQIISYLNKQLNDLQLRPERAMVGPNDPWFSTPNETNNRPAPNIPLSTLRPSLLNLGQTTLDNRENDEPLDPKYFQPKSYGGLVRKDSIKTSGDKITPKSNKPSAYFHGKK